MSLLALLATHFAIFVVFFCIAVPLLFFFTWSREKDTDTALSFTHKFTRNAWHFSLMLWVAFLGLIAVSMVYDSGQQEQAKQRYAQEEAEYRRKVQEIVNRKN